jgi:hypothetical protein
MATKKLSEDAKLAKKKRLNFDILEKVKNAIVFNNLVACEGTWIFSASRKCSFSPRHGKLLHVRKQRKPKCRKLTFKNIILRRQMTTKDSGGGGGQTCKVVVDFCTKTKYWRIDMSASQFLDEQNIQKLEQAP